jgi:hypothetical protein
LIVPVQANPQASIEWQAFRLNGQDALAARASKKLKNDELLVTGFAASRLKMDWTKCGEHVAMKQLVEDFARYVYLPRLRQTGVLLEAVREGLRLPLGILRLSIVRLDAARDETGKISDVDLAVRLTPGAGDHAFWTMTTRLVSSAR